MPREVCFPIGKDGAKEVIEVTYQSPGSKGMKVREGEGRKVQGQRRGVASRAVVLGQGDSYPTQTAVGSAWSQFGLPQMGVKVLLLLLGRSSWSLISACGVDAAKHPVRTRQHPTAQSFQPRMLLEPRERSQGLEDRQER